MDSKNDHNLRNNVHYQLIAKRHPHIARKIELFFGYPELDDYINSLLIDTRDGARTGFDPEIVSALLKISVQ